MFTVLSNTRNANLYLISALGIMVVVLLAFTVVPSITAPKHADSPATGSQNAYIEFLRGEKVMYANPVRLSEALSAYHLGEKTIFASAVDSSSALSAYILGEKTIYPTTMDVGSALSAHHLGEKMIVSFDVRESALLQYRQGEKDAK